MPDLDKLYHLYTWLFRALFAIGSLSFTLVVIRSAWKELHR